MSLTASSARPALISTAQALELLLAAARPVPEIEVVPTLEAHHRVLAHALISALDVPPMAISAMDGYAVRAGDLAPAQAGLPVSLPVSQRIPAGHVAQALLPGTAARVFTGATIPSGADAVVMQEMAEADSLGVRFSSQATVGEWITAQGADIRAGAEILPAGHRLDAQALGLAASCARLAASWAPFAASCAPLAAASTPWAASCAPLAAFSTP